MNLHTQQVSEPVSHRAHNPKSRVQLPDLLPISDRPNNYAEGRDSDKDALCVDRSCRWLSENLEHNVSDHQQLAETYAEETRFLP